ncbi:TolC family protein [Breznakiella homolactica]|uniref:TolC family protein n=1 Tax=Breznakiella homolactica TaxID=2798577 RepID=A0A7T7XQL5_9SPIR|nr:TolC family protein [Breznakiella homolactica]QQO10692.1 TolC family protein [Breznakiella homolactica]
MKRLLFILITAAAGFTCFAGENINLEQARALALSNSKTLSKYGLATESALLDERTQLFSNLPSLSLGVSGSATLWGGDTDVTDSLSAGASISLSQTLWSGGKNTVLGSIQKIATQITRQEALAEYFAVLDSADTAYYGVLKAQAAMDAADAALEVAALSLSVAEIRLAGGVISYGEYLQAVAEHESKKTSISQAKRDLALGMAKLRSVTGFSGISEVEAVDFDYYETLIQALAGFSDDQFDSLTASLWTAVAAKNPELSKAVLQTQKADQSVNLAKKDYFPSLSASISTGINYSYNDNFSTAPGKVSINGSIPLDFWVTGTNVDTKKIALEQTMLDYYSTESNLDIEIQTGLLDCIAQASSVISSRKALEYAEKHFENSLELYRLSQASVSDLSDAAALVSSNRNQLINAQYGFLSCLSAIRSLGAFESEDQVIHLFMPVSL